MAIKNILVLGGSGTIGQKIIKNIFKNFKVTVFDKKKLNKNLASKVKFIKGNCLNEKDLKKIPRNIDIVIFLLGYKGGPDSLKLIFYQKYFKENCENLNIFLEKNKIKKIKKIIFTSTEHVYGDNQNVGNNLLKKEVFPKNFYGSTKLLAEKILFNYWLKNKVCVDILRFPRIILDNKNLISKIIYSAIFKKKIIIKKTKAKFNFLHIDDFLVAINKSIFQLKSKYRILNVYNDSSALTIENIAKQIKNKLSLKIKINYLKKNNFVDHNPINLSVSNKHTKKQLTWNPKISNKKIIEKLIKEYEIK